MNILYNDNLTYLENHIEAARTMANKHSMTGIWVAGIGKKGFVFVNIDDPYGEEIIFQITA